MELIKSFIVKNISLIPKVKKTSLVRITKLDKKKLIKLILILTSKRLQLKKRNIVVEDMEENVQDVNAITMKENLVKKLILLLALKITLLI